MQSDVYACGVVLYELLTGVVPIPGDYPEIVGRVMSVTPEPPSRHVPSLDARIDRVVLKALAKDREIRHASVRELRAELKETAEEISIFSAGGYWNDVSGAVGAPTSSGAPAPPTEGTPDWLERGQGYMGSLPPAAAASTPPQRTVPPQSAGAGRRSRPDTSARRASDPSSRRRSAEPQPVSAT